MTLLYTTDHEWISLAGKIATVGITVHAQEQLGDIVFVSLPEVGATVAKGDGVAVVESVKAASDVYSPVSGTVTAVNAALADEPSEVNRSPEDAGWFFKVEIAHEAELDGLMNATSYQAFIG